MHNEYLPSNLSIAYRELLRCISYFDVTRKGVVITFNKKTKNIELHSIIQSNSKYVTADTPFWTNMSRGDRKYPESKPKDRIELFRLMVDFEAHKIPKNISQIKKFLKKK